MALIEHLEDRAVLTVTGADARKFLHGVVTQDIDSLTDGAARFACLLTPQGKILFDFFVVAAGDDFLIDVRGDSAEALARRLSLYKLRAKAAIEPAADWRVVASAEPLDGPLAFVDPRADDLGWRMATKGDAAGGGAAEYHARRIRAGAPEFGADFQSEAVFPLDVNYDALNGVNYKKGCFIGQEVASRMKRKGDARKRTLVAEFGADAPATGSTISAGGSTIGETMSAAGKAALALVRLDRLEKAREAGDALESEGGPLSLDRPVYLDRA